MSDLTPEHLFKAWIFQDKIDDMAKSLLTAGIELGVKAATLTMAEESLKGKLTVADPECFDEIARLASGKATNAMEEKLNARKKD